MKKRLLLLSILILALTLCACGEVRAPKATSAPTAAPTPSPLPTPSHPPEQFPYDYEEVLADTEDFSLTVSALGVDWENNWVVHLKLENRSDEVMNFRFLYQSINGLAIDETFSYRLAIGDTQEQSFRILREELAAWGEEEPVQWSFLLRVSSAESNRDPYFYEELTASPFGQARALRYEYRPAASDFVVMDNVYATVYITGWQVEDEGLCIDYVAVSHSDQPLLLTLQDEAILLDGHSHKGILRDGFGARSTLFGYIPVADYEAESAPVSIQLGLMLLDPTEKDAPVLEDSEVHFVLNAPQD